MATIKKFEELECWQLARQLSNMIFRFSESGKFSADFGLKGQIRKACGSVMDNIAEVLVAGEIKNFLIF